MKFIVDQPVSPLLAKWLSDNGHDAVHVRDRGLSRAKDQALFELATVERRVIVTTDLDFSRILALSGRNQPGLSDDEMLALLQQVLQRVGAASIERSASVIDHQSIRIAGLPLRPDLAPSDP